MLVFRGINNEFIDTNMDTKKEANLNTVEIKAFVPAKDFELSKSFYQELGFTMASEGGGVAYFYTGSSSFLLQDFYEETLANNFVMHLLVEDITAWHSHLKASGVAEKYQIELTDIVEQPWRMLDFIIQDPSGVQWRIGQNND